MSSVVHPTAGSPAPAALCTVHTVTSSHYCRKLEWTALEGIRWVMIGFAFTIVAVLCLGIGGGFAFRHSILHSSSSSVELEFQSVVHSIAQVFEGTAAEAISALGLLSASLSVFDSNLTFVDFLAVSTPMRAGIRSPIVQWSPIVQESDRNAWQAYVNSQLSLDATFTAVSALAVQEFGAS